MTQEAVVLNNLPNGMAEVAVTRGTACGSNCGNCEACIYANELHTFAVNKINASKGQRVVLESKNSKILKAEFLVYVLPLIAMIAGYVIAYAFGAQEKICVLLCFICLFLSSAFLVLSQKGKKEIQHVIIRIKEE